LVDIAYKPVNSTNPSDASYIPRQSAPNYDDVGVSYKKFSKTKITDNTSQLNPQYPRHITLNLDNGAFRSTLFTRPNPKKTFYCTGMQWHWKLGGGIFKNQFHLADVDKNGSAEIRIYEYVFQVGEQNFFLDLKHCPREFSGEQLDLYTQGSFSSGDFLHVQLFGWEE